MDYHQQLAAGKQPGPEEHEGAGHKLGWIAIIVLIVVSIILDAISILDVFALDIPIADIIAGALAILMFIFFIYKGLLGVRNLVTTIIGFILELIPGVDWLPLYLIAIIIVIVIDRNDALSRVAQTAAKYVPQGAGKGAGVTKVAGRNVANKAGTTALSRQLARNKVFGGASEQYLKKAYEITNKLPGPLRSLPEDGPKGFKMPEKMGAKQWMSAAKEAYQESKGIRQRRDDDPFGTYQDIKDATVPEDLNQIMRIDVDGSGATADTPPPRPFKPGKKDEGGGS